MALFGRKKSRGAEALDEFEMVTQLVQIRFQVNEHPVTVDPATRGMGTVVVDADGNRVALAEIFTAVLALDDPREQRIPVVMEWVDRMFVGESVDTPTAFTDEEWATRVSVRLALTDIRDHLSVAYARPVAGDLVAGLSIATDAGEFWITDNLLQGRDVTALFNSGFARIMAEPFDSTRDVVPGVVGLFGDSIFTASKALGLAHLAGTVLPAAPFGIVFGVPQRHVIYAHVITGEESVQALANIAHLISQHASSGQNPGGPLSSRTYFWQAGSIDEVPSDPEQGMVVDPSSRLGLALGAAIGAQRLGVPSRE